MSNLLKTGSDFLESQRKTFMTETVTYTRGEDSVSLAATIGKVPVESTDANGFTIQSEVVDFLITAADLILDDATVLPEVGDTITYGTKIYEVMNMPGMGHYRYSDSFGKTFRIHTKEITQ
jgi:hypothetical protein